MMYNNSNDKNNKGCVRINIEIKQNVKDYLNHQNVQDIYIEMDNRGGCCSGPIYVPTVKLGKPTYDAMYDRFEQNDIACYLPKKMLNEETPDITIKLRNFLGRKSLSVNGLLAYKEDGYKKKKI
nr:CC/Se motif family (seleno)protein [uncultured Acetobacterium sp.]